MASSVKAVALTVGAVAHRASACCMFSICILTDNHDNQRRPYSFCVVLVLVFAFSGGKDLPSGGSILPELADISFLPRPCASKPCNIGA